MIFGQKMAIFHLFFLGSIGQEIVFYDIVERKNIVLKSWVNPWFLVKKWPFFHLLFLGNIEQENVFDDIVVRKNIFLGFKSKKLKKSKMWDFSKRVDPWFWSKNGHFSMFFLGNIGQEDVFYDILKRKKPFLGY